MPFLALRQGWLPVCAVVATVLIAAHHPAVAGLLAHEPLHTPAWVNPTPAAPLAAPLATPAGPATDSDWTASWRQLFAAAGSLTWTDSADDIAGASPAGRIPPFGRWTIGAVAMLGAATCGAGMLRARSRARAAHRMFDRLVAAERSRWA